MDIFLWILQGVLALYYVVHGAMQLSLPEETLYDKMPWVEDASILLIRALGLIELAAAIGLIVPMAIHILPSITVVTAMVLSIISIVAVVVHNLRGDGRNIVINLVLIVITVAIAIGRWDIAWS